MDKSSKIKDRKKDQARLKAELYKKAVENVKKTSLTGGSLCPVFHMKTEDV